MLIAGTAKIHVPRRSGRRVAATIYRRKSQFAVGHMILGAALANLGKLEEARVGSPSRTRVEPEIHRPPLPIGAESDNSVFLAQREHLLEGLRKAGLPEE
jgi:hypothetical protein